jgi:BMFP domain-containing protein YqiC
LHAIRGGTNIWDKNEELLRRIAELEAKRSESIH